MALGRPALVASLLLSAPGGALIPAATDDLRAFVRAETAALEVEDLDGAVEANLSWWVDGPFRESDGVDPAVRESVRGMQRRALEIAAAWGDVEEDELDPPALDRLGEVAAPTLVVQGGLDLDAIRDAARQVTEGVPGARRIDWPDVAHLPSMERPEDFLDVLRAWLRTSNVAAPRPALS
ncbi:alpha/beta fold hydrolase [Georgenia sp. SUBG003]|uniref:alpha/beta fold hydrolase n=1 Tax=Georgenia sp. SUBG003 TaxID=1497974 RepID=UPI003AB12969